MSRIARQLPLVAAAVLLVAGQADAAVARVVGPTPIVSEPRAFVKFDASYDSIHRVYLAVWGTQTPAGATGLFLNEAGVPITAPFPLSDGPLQSGWCRAIFSAEQGKFLVTYSKILSANSLQKVARFVTYVNGAPSLGPEILIDSWVGNAGTATGIAYSAAAGKFLVTWSHYFTSVPGATFPHTFIATIDGAGTLSQAQIVSNPTDGQSDPEIACDPAARRCLVVGTAWGTGVGGKSAFWGRFVDDATGTPLGATSSYIFVWGGLVDPAGVIFSPAEAGGPAQFLIGIGTGGKITGMTANGAVLNFGAPFTMIAPSNTEGVGMGFLSLRYNPGTRSTIATTSTWVGMAGIQELDGNGTRVANGFNLIPDQGDDPGHPFETANEFTVAAMNPVTNQFLVLENHNWHTMRASVFNGTSPIAPPAITANPAPVVYARAGHGALFTASATGGPMPSVQWQVKPPGGAAFLDIPGGTSSALGFVAVRSQSGSLIRAHFMNASGDVFSTASTLIVVPGPLNDVDGDGRSDALVWRPGTGTWFWLGSTANPANSSKQWGAAGDMSLTGDIDGDGVADLVIWRPSIGSWFWLTSSTGYDYGSAGRLQWGAQGDVPMLADVDGDGKDDLIVWRAATGVWYWLTSSTGYSYASAQALQWGAPGDSPLTGDFDGDGKADFVVWRPSSGVFFWLTSTSGYSYSAASLKQWGIGALGDTPFIGDVDGDHRADLVVWRATTGTWYWLTSSSGYTYSPLAQKQWGSAALGDVPMLADVDGDGISDLEVWRSMTGDWFWLTSSTGYSYAGQGSKKFGMGGDVPIVR